MRGIGWLLLGVAAVWLLYALTLDTSVALPYGMGAGRVQNLSLMEHRRTQLMLSGGTLIVGVLLLGFGRFQRPSDDDEGGDGLRQCPYCAEWVREEAILCKHCRSELAAMERAESDQPLEQFELMDEPDEQGQAYSYRALREATEAAEKKTQVESRGEA